jgi:hypothetical protein
VPGIRDWCFTNALKTAWGFCECTVLPNDPLLCSDEPAWNLTGPSKAVQVALFHVGMEGNCSAPVAYDVRTAPVPQAYGSPVVVVANVSDGENDRVSYQIVQEPIYGFIVNKTEFEETGVLRYQIDPFHATYFFGEDVVMYRAVETGVTDDGQVMPCARASSNAARMTIVVYDLNDTPVILFNLTDQPDARLRAYANQPNLTAFFDLNIDEDTTFSFDVLAQV